MLKQVTVDRKCLISNGLVYCLSQKKNIFYILNKSWNGDEQQITEYVYYLITTITYNDIFLIFNDRKNQ